MNKIIAFLLLLPFFQASCEKEQIENSPVDGYFQFEYVNYAWGFNHSGFTITPKGEVFSFSKTTPWIFAENEVISFESFQKNLAASFKIDTIISNTELDLYKKLAASALSGNLSDSLQVGADMGATICKMIIPDNDNKSNYREYILTQTGDWEKHNLAPEAATIANWLTKLNNELF